jgi:hypothetical protein
VRDIISMLDQLLDPFAGLLGDDFNAYRNHACRVASFYSLLEPEADHDMTKLAVAAAYHDIGIWTAGSFDYILPSTELATNVLREKGRTDLIDEVTAMIRDHHKLTPCCSRIPRSAEHFRKADWMDVSTGILHFGITRNAARDVKQRFPGAGFHRLLLKLSLKRAFTHPLSPLPMLRW